MPLFYDQQPQAGESCDRSDDIALADTGLRGDALLINSRLAILAASVPHDHYTYGQIVFRGVSVIHYRFNPFQRLGCAEVVHRERITSSANGGRVDLMPRRENLFSF